MRLIQCMYEGHFRNFYCCAHVFSLCYVWGAFWSMTNLRHPHTYVPVVHIYTTLRRILFIIFSRYTHIHTRKNSPHCFKNHRVRVLLIDQNSIVSCPFTILRPVLKPPHRELSFHTKTLTIRRYFSWGLFETFELLD